MNTEATCQNKFIKSFINDYVLIFRKSCDLRYSISISGLGNFLPNQDNNFCYLIEALREYGFSIDFTSDADTIEILQISYTSSADASTHQLECNIGNLISIITLSSKTSISIIAIIIMKIVSRLICQSKIMYKAIVLDLDDTLWTGTLSEDGINGIVRRMQTKEGNPFIAFMQFVKVMAEELGIFVALCSRNNIDDVRKAIDYMDESIFPLKDHIDFIVSNYNDKSSNIKQIASELSILPEAVVFIDDNALVRDEVKRNIPNAFIPEWESHDELVTLLTICCAFDRYELSLSSKNRKKHFGIIQSEREQNALPKLYIKVREDLYHKEALKLYAKSNQFKLISRSASYNNAKSLIFDIYRSNGESLGVCSALTYSENNCCIILNWAISCRYFEIGVEEFVILHLLQMMQGKTINMLHEERKDCGKVDELLHRYYGKCFTKIFDNVSLDLELSNKGDDDDLRNLLQQLKSNNGETINIYRLNNHNELRNNTHIQVYE